MQWILGTIIVFLLGLLTFFIRNRFNREEKSIDCLEKKIVELKEGFAITVNFKDCEDKRNCIEKELKEHNTILTEVATVQKVILREVQKINGSNDKNENETAM